MLWELPRDGPRTEHDRYAVPKKSRLVVRLLQSSADPLRALCVLCGSNKLLFVDDSNKLLPSVGSSNEPLPFVVFP